MKYKEIHKYIDDELSVAGFGHPYYAYWIEYADGTKIHTHSQKELTDKEIKDLHKISEKLSLEK